MLCARKITKNNVFSNRNAAIAANNRMYFFSVSRMRGADYSALCFPTIGNSVILRTVHPYGISSILSRFLLTCGLDMMLYGIGPAIPLYSFQLLNLTASVDMLHGAFSSFHGKPSPANFSSREKA